VETWVEFQGNPCEIFDQTSGIFTGFSLNTSDFPCQLLFQQYFSFILPSIGPGTVGPLMATVPVSRRNMMEY